MNHWVLLTLGKVFLLCTSCAVVIRHGSYLPGRWILLLQLCVATIAEMMASILMIQHQNNLRIYTIHEFVEFGLLMLFARQLWDHRIFRLTLVLMAMVFLLVAIPDLQRSWPLQRSMVAGTMTGSALLLCTFVALLFREALLVDGALFQRPISWILLGMVFYFGGMLPIQGLLNTISAENIELAAQLYIINDVLFAVRFGAIIAAILYFRERSPHLVP